MDNIPRIIEETGDFAVVFKPPKMHSREQGTMAKHDNGTLFGWYAEHSPPVFDIMHRLDFETNGLALFAKNKKSFDFFKDLQDTGQFIKEYSAIVTRNDLFGTGQVGEASPGEASPGEKSLGSFPPDGFSPEGFPQAPVFKCTPSFEEPAVIESFFRPYGPGRKLVRPVTETASKRHYKIAMDKGGLYKTEIIDINGNVFTVRIKRGFRHQIRCHLCWIGFPLLNDPLYPQPVHENSIAFTGKMALRAHALFFADPASGKQRECRISSISSLS